MFRDIAISAYMAVVLVGLLGLIGGASSFTVASSSSFGVKASLLTTAKRTCVGSTPLYVGEEQATPATVEEPESTEGNDAAAANKRKVQRERHTLFVGNLPFGK